MDYSYHGFPILHVSRPVLAADSRWSRASLQGQITPHTPTTPHSPTATPCSSPQPQPLLPPFCPQSHHSLPECTLFCHLVYTSLSHSWLVLPWIWLKSLHQQKLRRCIIIMLNAGTSSPLVKLRSSGYQQNGVYQCLVLMQDKGEELSLAVPEQSAESAIIPQALPRGGTRRHHSTPRPASDKKQEPIGRLRVAP